VELALVNEKFYSLSNDQNPLAKRVVQSDPIVHQGPKGRGLSRQDFTEQLKNLQTFQGRQKTFTCRQRETLCGLYTERWRGRTRTLRGLVVRLLHRETEAKRAHLTLVTIRQICYSCKHLRKKKSTCAISLERSKRLLLRTHTSKL